MRAGAILPAVFCLLLAGGRPAASQQQAAPGAASGYESRVDLKLEAVFVDTDGNRDKFWTDQYLRSGFNTGGVLLDFRPLDASRAFFDFLTVTASGLGDSSPYQNGSLRMARRRLYDLRADYRKYNYFFGLPEFAVGLHSENSAARSAGVNLKLLPDRRISFLAGYRRHQLYGTRFSSQALPLDTYQVSYPRRLASDELSGGVEFNRRPLMLRFEQSFLRFRDDSQVFPAAAEGLGGNTLEEGFRDLPTRVGTPVSRVLGRYQAGRKYEVVGRYLYSGADLDVSRLENFLARPGASPVLAREILSSSGASEKPTHNAGVTQSWAITDRLDLYHRFVYEDYTLTGLLATSGVLRLINELTGQELDFPFTGLGGTVTAYKLGRNETELRFAASRSLSLVGQHRYMDRHMAFGEQGTNPRPVVTITNAGGGGVIWTPGAKGRIRADVEKGVATEAFNRIDPLSFLRWRVLGRVRVTPKITISGNLVIEDNRNDTAGVNYDLDNRQFGIQAVAAPSRKFLITAGYQYYRLRTATDIVFYAMSELTGGTSLYETNTHALNAAIEAPITDRLALRFGIGYLEDNGETYPLSFANQRAGFSLRLVKGIYFETDWGRFSYSEKRFDLRDYTTNVLRTGLRFTH